MALTQAVAQVAQVVLEDLLAQQELDLVVLVEAEADILAQRQVPLEAAEAEAQVVLTQMAVLAALVVFYFTTKEIYKWLHLQ